MPTANEGSELGGCQVVGFLEELRGVEVRIGKTVSPGQAIDHSTATIDTKKVHARKVHGIEGHTSTNYPVQEGKMFASQIYRTQEQYKSVSWPLLEQLT